MGILSAITFIPLIGAAAILCLPKENKAAVRWLATLTAAIPLALCVMIYLRFDSTTPAFQFLESFDWIPSFNIKYSLGISDTT